MPRLFLAAAGFGFLTGIAAAANWPGGWGWFGLFFVLALGFLSVSFWLKKPAAKLALVGLGFFCLAVWRYGLSQPVLAPGAVELWQGQAVVAQGTVAREPDWRPRQQNLVVRLKRLRPAPALASQASAGAPGFLPASGLVWLVIRPYPEYQYGDQIEFQGRLQAPQPFAGFAYDRYLARFGIYTLCRYPQIKLLSRGGRSWTAKIFQFKKAWRRLLGRGLPSPEAEFAQAVLIGDKHAPSKYWRRVFSQVGLSHIMAISGMHISILAAILINFLIALGFARRPAFWLTSGTLALYVVLIGAPASALRALLVGFLVLFGLAFGRLSQSLNLLVLAAVALLLANPRLLRDDVGFQLSFLAVLGIVLFYNYLNEYLKGNKLAKIMPAPIRSVLAITVCAQLMTWPVVVYNFKIFPAVSILANLAVVWLLPLLLLSLLLASLLAFLLPAAGWLAFLPADVILRFIKNAAQFLAGLKFSFWPLKSFALFWLFAWYGLVIAVYVIIKKGGKFIG